jgi:thioester reductase-like protein
MDKVQKQCIAPLSETFKFRLTAGVQERYFIITGDVSLLNLGLSEDDYMYLVYEVDSIIHAAATVNLVHPYHALYDANVLGTDNILTFAINHKIKPVHHIR